MINLMFMTNLLYFKYYYIKLLVWMLLDGMHKFANVCIEVWT